MRGASERPGGAPWVPGGRDPVRQRRECGVHGLGPSIARCALLYALHHRRARTSYLASAGIVPWDSALGDFWQGPGGGGRVPSSFLGDLRPEGRQRHHASRITHQGDRSPREGIVGHGGGGGGVTNQRYDGSGSGCSALGPPFASSRLD